MDDGNNGFGMEDEDEADIAYRKRLVDFLENALGTKKEPVTFMNLKG